MHPRMRCGLAGTSCVILVSAALVACEGKKPPTPATMPAIEALAPEPSKAAAPQAQEPAAATAEPSPVATVTPTAPSGAQAPAAKPVERVEPAPKAASTSTKLAPTAAPKAPAEPAKTEAPKTELPKTEAPTVEPPKTEAPATKVTIPQSKHVQVKVPARMQSLLDADSRMEKWLASTMGTIEQCYASERAKNPKAAGTVKATLTMHANARPDADVDSLPPALSGVFACATGKLMRGARMPLFTGKEGERHSVSVKFSP